MIGIIGESPIGHLGILRAGNFAKFQNHVGRLEEHGPEQFPAGYAVGHALMNDVAGVLFYGVENARHPGQLREAVRDLATQSGLRMLVVPGLTDEVVVEELIAAVGDFAARLTLWLDPPVDSLPDDVVAFRSRLSGNRQSVRVAWPWVPTVSPGRRTSEELPPSCLIGPLYVGSVKRLQGAHELGLPPAPAVKSMLKAARCGLLVRTGKRRLIALDFPDPIGRPAGESDPLTLDEKIEAALDDISARKLAAGLRGKSLWKNIERESRPVMLGFQRRGEILSYRLQCDEETNQGEPAGVHIEVWYNTPRRVAEVILKISVMERRRKGG
jgi:hypothetical protein